MDELAANNCEPCRSGAPRLSADEVTELHRQTPDWQIIAPGGVERLERVFKFRNFAEALAFTDRVGALAEEQGHHPLLVTEWGKVTVQWWTHKIGGLHRNDFVMAAKTDQLAG